MSVKRAGFLLLNVLLGGAGGALLWWKQVYLPGHPAPVLLTVAPALLRRESAACYGNPGSPYTLVEFADYQCPPCRALAPELSALVQQASGRVKLDFRNYPLDFHHMAFPAAVAAEQARAQGCFWAMHDGLFAVQKELDAPHLDALASSLHVRRGAAQEHGSDAAKESVRRDKALGDLLGVQGTPALFLCTPQGQVYRVYTPAQVMALMR